MTPGKPSHEAVASKGLCAQELRNIRLPKKGKNKLGGNFEELLEKGGTRHGG